MNQGSIDTIKAAAVQCGCEINTNEPLSAHTSFGIGGSAALFIEAAPEGLSQLIKTITAENIPFMALGKGSNMLFSDAPHDMVILHFGRAFSGVEITGNTVTAYAGTPLSNVCTAARDAGLTGLEFAYGIPGSVGGAVYMNAGAYGGEMAQVLKSVKAVDMQGNERIFAADELGLSYRRSVFAENGYIIVSAEMVLEKGDKAEITAKMNELMDRRRDKQPLEYKSAGSTFKRPVGAFAGGLIEQCGLKGYSVGDAQVSTKHAGFVINTGKASFDDVMSVIVHVQDVVKEKTGFELECEVRIIR